MISWHPTLAPAFRIALVLGLSPLAAPASLAGPAGGQTGRQQEEVIDTIALVCEGTAGQPPATPYTFCPADSTDPGYCIPGAQQDRIFHPVCNPGLTISPSCTTEPVGARACVPLVAQSIPGCVAGDTSNCARLRVTGEYVPVEPWALCQLLNDPLCANLDVSIELEIFGPSWPSLSLSESFRNPNGGFTISDDCNNDSNDGRGVRIGDWFPFRELACVLPLPGESGVGINWDGLILPGNPPHPAPFYNPAAPDPKLVDLEGELQSYAANAFDLPFALIFPTAMQDRGARPGASSDFSPSERYANTINFVMRTGTYPLPLNFALAAPTPRPTEEQLLFGPGTAGSSFGVAVALDGNTLAVGASGERAVWLFEKLGSSWGFSQRITGSDSTSGDGFGGSVALDGDTLVVGASVQNSSRGAAYVFRRGGGGWTQEAKLLPPSPLASGGFGGDVAIDADVVVVGQREDQVSTGRVHVFRRSGTTWGLEQTFTHPSPLVDDNFGRAVDVSGNRIAIGVAERHVSGVADAGEVRIYRFDGVSWVPQATLSPAALIDDEDFGHVLDLDADRLIVGTSLAGSAYVFRGTNGAWAQEAHLVPGPPFDDSFGMAVAIDRRTAVVGIPFESSLQGAFTLYRHDGSGWVQEDHRLGANDEFLGQAVAVQRRDVAAGARGYGNVGGSPTEAGSTSTFIRPPQTTLLVQGPVSGGETFDVLVDGFAIDFQVAPGTTNASSVATQLAQRLDDGIVIPILAAYATPIGARLILDADPAVVSVIDDTPADGLTITEGDNDRPGDAFSIGTGSLISTLEGAGQDFSSPGCGSAGDGVDVWYEFTAPTEGTLRVDTCGAHGAFGMDTFLAIHGSDGAIGPELTCNDDYLDSADPDRCAGFSTLDSFVEKAMAPGERVRIRASRFAFGSTVGPFLLNVDFDVALPECSDGIDNDGDGGIDLADLGCDGPGDLSERSPLFACDDGADNDGDGAADFPSDIGCRYPDSTRESPQCQDGVDNDHDGRIDFDGGASRGVSPPTQPDAHCFANGQYVAWDHREKSAGCGIGFELALVLPGIGSLLARARRRQVAAREAT
jgi:hypothetical protein